MNAFYRGTRAAVWTGAYLLGLAATGHAMPPLAQNFWTPNGPVLAIAQFDTTVFIGGSFTELMPAPAGGIPVDAATGSTTPGFPRVTGQVFCVAPDGSGGWYIGGSFNQVGGLPRNNLAHLASDLSVTAWNPAPDGPVRALLPDTLGNVYVGGEFSLIGGVPRARLAQVNPSGQATLWHPLTPDASVNALAFSGATILAGGAFLLMGGQPRAHLAQVSTIDGSLGGWNPTCDGNVRTLAVFTRRQGPLPLTTVLVGGSFQNVNLSPRAYLAEVRLDGSTSAWNPQLDGPVTALLTHNRIYVGGGFTHFNGQPRNHAAAVDTLLSTIPTPWDPNAGDSVETMAWSASRVFLGGKFATVGAQSRAYLASVDDTTGGVDSWNPQINGEVHALAIGNSTVYAGGTFSFGTPLARKNLAALSTRTGLPTTWDPSMNGTVRAIALRTHGPTLFSIIAGGDFTSVGNTASSRLAAISPWTGAPNWVANVNDTVFCVAVKDTTVYAGGAFTMVNNLVEHRMVALGAQTGKVLSWGCSAEGGDVLAIGLDPYVFANQFWIGGSFTSVNGYPYSYMADVSTTTGNPSTGGLTNGIVRAIAVPRGLEAGGPLWLGGDFTNANGLNGTHLALLGASWNPMADGVVRCIAGNGTTIWAGGDFTHIEGVPDSGLVSVSELGAVTSGDPVFAGGSVYADAASYRGQVFAGGSFLSVGGVPQANFAAFLPSPVCLGAGVGSPVVGEAPASMASGDFDSDGILDLVTCNTAYPPSLSVLHGNGDGTFTPTYWVPLTSRPTKVVVADFDRDGHQDIAVAESGTTDGLVAIYHNDGPVFTLEASAPSGGPTDGLAVGDLDDDGILDLLVCVSDSSATPGWGYAKVIRGGGSGGVWDGTLVPAASVTVVGVNYAPRQVVLSDFDQDGYPDYVISGNEVYEWFWRGGPGAVPPYGVAGDDLPLDALTGTALAMGDFNGDGNQDYAAVFGNSVVVWLKRPSPPSPSQWFGGEVVAALPSTPRDIAVLDYNQDGILDIAATLDSLAEVVVCLGHAKGGVWDSTFSAPVVLAHTDCWGLTVGDFNGDGSPDLEFSEPGCDAVVTLINPNPPTLSPLLHLLAPNGGEIWSAQAPEPPGNGFRVYGSSAGTTPDQAPRPLYATQQIEWEKGAGVQGVDVDVSRDGGTTWQTIGSNVPGTSMNWIVTPPGTTQGLVRVRDTAVQGRMDVSDAPFNVEAPTTGVAPGPQVDVTAFTIDGRNPSRGPIRFEVELSKPAAVSVQVFDVSGRLVRALAHGPWPAGKRDLVWDLRDDGGRTAGRGIYFVQGRIGSYKVTRKVVVLG